MNRNIFFVGIDVDSLGGSQRVIHTLAQGFGERGHRVEVIGIRPAEEPFAFNAVPAYRHTTLYEASPPPAWHAQTLVERLSPRKNVEAKVALRNRIQARDRLLERLNSVSEGFLVFGSPWAADWVLGLPIDHLKCIGQYHESFAQAKASANQRLIQRHYPRLEKALFLSGEDARAFERLRLPNAAVMPNPLSFYPDETASLTAPRMSAVGRLVSIKRLDRLIDAFALVADLHPDWTLDLVGDGPEEDKLRQHAEELGVDKRVVFSGRRDDMIDVYMNTSVLALSSEREGRPMALAEASACGVPCVSFDVSDGVRSLVADRETGILVPPGDVAALADALDQLMSDESLRRAYGAAAREHVRPFSLSMVLDHWERLFAEIDR